MKKFITSDWHLGDTRLGILRRYGFKDALEVANHLVKVHNSVVESSDFVIFLGDCQYNNADGSWLEHISRFNGNKILVRGNHDRIYDDSDFKPYFCEIIEDGGGLDIEVDGIEFWATHYPSCSRVDRFNLVGHIHDLWKVQLNMINVGVDANHYYPIDVATLPDFCNAIDEYFDLDVFASYHPANTFYRDSRGKKNSYFG